MNIHKALLILSSSIGVFFSSPLISMTATLRIHNNTHSELTRITITDGNGTILLKNLALSKKRTPSEEFSNNTTSSPFTITRWPLTLTYRRRGKDFSIQWTEEIFRGFIRAGSLVNIPDTFIGTISGFIIINEEGISNRVTDIHPFFLHATTPIIVPVPSVIPQHPLPILPPSMPTPALAGMTAHLTIRNGTSLPITKIIVTDGNKQVLLQEELPALQERFPGSALSSPFIITYWPLTIMYRRKGTDFTAYWSEEEFKDFITRTSPLKISENFKGSITGTITINEKANSVSLSATDNAPQQPHRRPLPPTPSISTPKPVVIPSSLTPLLLTEEPNIQATQRPPTPPIRTVSLQKSPQQPIIMLPVQEPALQETPEPTLIPTPSNTLSTPEEPAQPSPFSGATTTILVKEPATQKAPEPIVSTTILTTPQESPQSPPSPDYTSSSSDEEPSALATLLQQQHGKLKKQQATQQPLPISLKPSQEKEWQAITDLIVLEAIQQKLLKQLSQLNFGTMTREGLFKHLQDLSKQKELALKRIEELANKIVTTDADTKEKTTLEANIKKLDQGIQETSKKIQDIEKKAGSDYSQQIKQIETDLNFINHRIKTLKPPEDEWED